MASHSAQLTDARHATIYNVGGSQYIYKSHNSKDSVLDKLKPANMDGSMRTGCLNNTRADVLTLVIDWVCNPGSVQRTLWLHGPPGSGKSTISTTLAERFRQFKQLGAFLFFNRDDIERSHPALVARTLAHQISLSHPEIGVFIISAIEDNPHLLISPISSQFYELVINPLSCVSTKSEIVLVLDALDECGTKTDRKILLDTLAEQSANLPPNARLVIISRPDLDMRLAFELQPHVKTLELDLTSAVSFNDILAYIQHRMKSIRMKNRVLGIEWPGEKNIYTLTRRACGLFVWASIVCNFIDTHDPRKRLEIILQGNQAPRAEAALDSLYRTALEVLGVWDDEDFVTDFRAIVGIMLVLRNPLTTVAIDNLVANSDRQPSAQTIEKLSCVVSMNPRLRFIHPSVADFLTDRLRGGCEIWFFTSAFYERNLAILCLRHLNEVLHCDMSQWAPLVDREDDAIPKDVSYACVFWVDHICVVEDDLRLIEELLETFIDQHILRWLEAMSLLRRLSLTITLLGRLLNWIRTSHHCLSNTESLHNRVFRWKQFCEEYETYIQDFPMQVYSEELHREFPFTQVQEPLISRPPAPSIFNLPLFPQPTPDVSSRRDSLGSFTSQPESPYHSDSCNSTPSVSRSATPDFTRFGRRLSRSSLDLPSHRSSSGSSVSRPPSPSGTYLTASNLHSTSPDPPSASSVHSSSSGIDNGSSTVHHPVRYLKLGKPHADTTSSQQQHSYGQMGSVAQPESKPQATFLTKLYGYVLSYLFRVGED
ncbi:hypothetical protein PILCRDRAFT_526836 [Piloderma croceum F 1598]|uniref:NACHT domain-containing protein n=1 Tax=Piloderma croceum (strain F 1598) TaxID=765440 RepID=A0A0C3B2Z9_PILCF|nr:hypothetical protein PILCRDRAFT_526836 [Piloderma croceum F 1598]